MNAFRSLVLAGISQLRFRHQLLVLVLLTHLAVAVLVYGFVAPLSSIWRWMAGASGVWTLFLWWRFNQNIEQKLQRLHADLQRIQMGDLRCSEWPKNQDEFSLLGSALQAMTETLSSLSAEIRSNAALVAHVGEQLQTDSKELAARTEQQAANLEESSACLEQISSVVQQNAENTMASASASSDMMKMAQQGVQSMNAAVISVQTVQTHAQQMNDMVDAIHRLASQTTILALNASIEAARAGEQGRGFAVVAAEVRQLAQQSSQAADAVQRMIEQSGQGIHQSMTLIQQTSDILSDLHSGIQKLATLNTQISQASREQSTGLIEVSTAVQQMDQITQKNAQMVDQTVTDAYKLNTHAQDLMHSVASFKLQQGTADEALDLVQRAFRAFTRQTNLDVYCKTLSEPSQPFHDRDMYVFVINAQGHYLAFGGHPEKVGSRIQDISGIEGQKLVDDIVSQAQKRPGWVEYQIIHPISQQVQTKISFVQELCEGVYLGCGVYKSLART